MAEVYDRWERLVRATLRREEFRLTAQRTPSDLSLASSASPFNFISSSRRALAFKFNVGRPLVGKKFDYNQILRATNYFSDSNLIRHGHSGELFYGALKGGKKVVVKKIDLSTVKKDFFGKVSHPRLVPLLGCCFENWDGSNNYLVYEYMPKYLSRSLLQSLDWEKRLRIAIGTAEALCYLHHGCVQPLVHGDVQASSILLDDNFEVRLGGLSNVCVQRGHSNQRGKGRFPWLRLVSEEGPDLKDGILTMGSEQGPDRKDGILSMGSEQGPSGFCDATCSDDVFCFGKVLLELVTGDLGFRTEIGYKAMVRMSNEGLATRYEAMVRMSDACPYLIDNITLTDIVDKSLSVDYEVRAMAIVAEACLKSNPSKRPIMRQILEALKDPWYVIYGEHVRFKRAFLKRITTA